MNKAMIKAMQKGYSGKFTAERLQQKLQGDSRTAVRSQ